MSENIAFVALLVPCEVALAAERAHAQGCPSSADLRPELRNGLLEENRLVGRSA